MIQPSSVKMLGGFVFSGSVACGIPALYFATAKPRSGRSGSVELPSDVPLLKETMFDNCGQLIHLEMRAALNWAHNCVKAVGAVADANIPVGDDE